MSTHDQALPDLSDERVAEIEKQLFDAVGAEPRTGTNAEDERRRRVRRGRLWLAGGTAAAVIVVAAVIAPYVSGITSNSAGSMVDQSSSGALPEMAPDFSDADGGATADEQGGADDLAGPDAGVTSSEREIIATASASVRVDDVRAAADRITVIAEDAGGYVEALSMGADGQFVVLGTSPGVSYPAEVSSAWISVRVPADQLDAVTQSLAGVGDVTSSQLDRRDVTSEAVDLRARIDALRTSVERLESLMADAESTADLLAAESALADRQAQLESYEQQLKYLEDQVGMSSLTVSLYEPSEVVQADPAGFGDGIAAGWNGLVATLNGIVIALGFLLPWLAVIAVVGVVVWLIRRAVRARRVRRSTAVPDSDDEPGDRA
ncbi:DUF4349 domain-containing protein [Microbacterium invictum]|uniref:DUF4349 domain-containing protein n=1 Tax=Microbacterium invictum TaxID=515415 RepID=A0AA40VM32_9MICO|nr:MULTISPECIES: DUF4349 domain-containing protein [Microbacterium]MBB4138903.1 hypothetical protein [Microbacterium invictum]